VARNGPAPCSPGWLETWAVAESIAQEAIDRVLAHHRAPTEPGIARALVDCLPSETTLVVSSSMPVRDVEWFARPRRDLRVLANRGANGIDGVVSTVLGAAASRPGSPTAGLLGDLALLHDAGALLGAALRELTCVMVVVDNDGGGIFSFLPQASALAEGDFERLFTTPHGLDLAGLARLHGLATYEVERIDELDRAVRTGFKTGAMTVIVVRTEQRANVRVHDELHAAVAAALDGLSLRAG
jgi:2-succinyl-5-enolpyruvyl-6-hydroxy-3-cyclohexene-1-carboxylate synthase